MLFVVVIVLSVGVGDFLTWEVVPLSYRLPVLGLAMIASGVWIVVTCEIDVIQHRRKRQQATETNPQKTPIRSEPWEKKLKFLSR